MVNPTRSPAAAIGARNARGRAVTTSADRRAQSTTNGWWYGGVMLVLLALLVYTVAWFRGDPVGRGFLMVPVLCALLVPFMVLTTRRTTGFDLGGILFAAFGLKLIATYARFWMVEDLYNGGGDSQLYHLWGRNLAGGYRRFDFGQDVQLPIPGTGFVRMLTGLVYAVFGADKFTGYLVFATLGFIGCWCFVRAFMLTVPNGDHKRLALLVLFWPSLQFWPASIGKESWMLLVLGVTSLGAAAAYARKPYGYPLLALGVAGSALPRPHIAIVVLAAAGVGLFMATVFGARAGEKKVGIGTKVVGIVFMLIAVSILAPRVATFLQIDDVDGSGFSDSLEEVNQRTSQGGSEYTAPEISSPIDYPWAFVTVLFRPFPYEVRSAASAVSALEGLLLLGVVGLSISRLVRLPVALMRNAYIAYAAAFAFMFAYVFSFIGNFGILARQRVQLLPFLFVLLAMPKGRDNSDAAGEPNLASRRPWARETTDERNHARPPSGHVRRQDAPHPHRAPTISPPRRRA